MNAEEIAKYIQQFVPTFVDISVVGGGVAYHYSCHAKRIVAEGHFRGAPLSPDLDRTQTKLESDPAVTSPGVVFAYEDLADAVEEGSVGADTHIFELLYSAAVRAVHSQEASLEDGPAPSTILIASSEILRFRLLGTATELNTR